MTTVSPTHVPAATPNAASAISSPLGPPRAGTPVPLFNLVYHDAIITPYRPADLHGFLTALHERVALLEMTGHEFLDAGRRKERTTFADGTTVTVDWESGTFSVSP
jgi:hypothetical protein